MTEQEFKDRMAAIAPANDEEAKRIACALLGHSKIQTTFFGYYYCARCGEQVGDSLGSTYSGAETAVIVGHACDVCRANYAALDWKHKVLAPEPFPPCKTCGIEDVPTIDGKCRPCFDKEYAEAVTA